MLKNIGSNWLLLAVTIVVSYLLVPFNIKHLGEEQYGLWLIITSWTGYLSLLQLGVPMASVRHMAKAIASKDWDQLNVLVASCAGLYLGLGAVAALAGLPMLLFYERAYPINEAMADTSRAAFLLSLINVGLGFFARLPYAIMNSYHDFVRVNILSMSTILLRAGVTVACLVYWPSLLVLAAILAGTTLLETILLWVIVLVVHKEVRLRPALFSRGTVREIVGFSIWVLLLNLGSQLSFQTDALVIGKYLGATQVPPFSVGNSLILYLMQFIVGIASVVMPTATALQAKGEMEELRRTFYKWSKLALALTFCAGAYLLVFGPDFLANWIGPKFEAPSGRVLRILMVSYLVFLPMRGVGLPVLMGLGQASRPTIAFLLAGVLNLVLSVALVGPMSLDGVAWGTSIPNLLLTVVLLGLVCRSLEVNIPAYLGDVLPKAIFGLVLVVAAAEGWHRWLHPRNFIELGVAGVVTVGIFGLIWIGFVLRNDPHVVLPERVRALLHRGK